MRFRLVTPPVALAVSLAEAQLAVRADVDQDGKSPLDADLERSIRTYTTEAESETSRAIMEQTWRLTLDAFPTCERGGPGPIQLQFPPLALVDHVKFYDRDGVQQTLDPQDYQVDSESEPGFLVPAPGKTWPATADRINAVEVQFQCGFGEDHTAVPDGIKGFILARVQEHLESGGQTKNEYVRRLLWPYKVHL
ncbi:head-tail connector protein [Massilia sp. DD77]|uniref:head-tail connector protein n=1 Tax=Massilia sp. DD77 TaxID=3109349 RepID=UPI002FFDAA74